MRMTQPTSFAEGVAYRSTLLEFATTTRTASTSADSNVQHVVQMSLFICALTLSGTNAQSIELGTWRA